MKTKTPIPSKPPLERKQPRRALLPKAGRGTPKASGASARGKAAGAPFTSAVSQGVELGYQVVQRYLEQGEKAARAFFEPGGRPDAGAAGGAAPPFAFNVDPFRRSAEELAQAFTQIFRTFSQMMVPPAAPGGPAPTPAADAGPFRMPGAAPLPAVTFALRGERAVTVHLSMSAASESRTAFEVPTLTHVDGRARLTDVRVFRSKRNEPLTVEVPLLVKTPAGRYEGHVFPHEGGPPLGRLAVVVGESG